MDPRFTSQATLIGYEHQKSTIDADRSLKSSKSRIVEIPVWNQEPNF